MLKAAEGKILEYDNPSSIILRGSQIFDPGWEIVKLSEGKYAGKVLNTCSFFPIKEDRIVICSDGVSQSGMGSEQLPFGWERDNVSAYASSLVAGEQSISA